MFLTICMTSIFDKWEDINICFVTRETQNCSSWTRDENPPNAPLSISSTILEKAFRKNAVQLF